MFSPKMFKPAIKVIVEKQPLKPTSLLVLPRRLLVSAHGKFELPTNLPLLAKTIVQYEAFDRINGHDEYAECDGQNSKSTLVYNPQHTDLLAHFISKQHWPQAFVFAVNATRNELLDAAQQGDLSLLVSQTMWMYPVTNISEVTQPSEIKINPEFKLPENTCFPTLESYNTAYLSAAM